MAETIKPAPQSYDANQLRLIEKLKEHTRMVMLGRYTELQIESGAKAFIDATTLMLHVGTNKMFDIMWDYHVQQHDQACNEVRALRGLTRFSEVRSYPTALVYNAFRACINNITWSSYNISLSKLPHGPELIAYLQAKQANHEQ